MAKELQFWELAEQARAYVGRQCVVDDDDDDDDDDDSGCVLLRGKVVAVSLVFIVENDEGRDYMAAYTGELSESFGDALGNLFSTEICDTP